MASIDLREAYLQVPVHPESRRFLRFVAHGRTYQFKALCFGLSTAPQVFTRVMAPVSAILHSLGIRMRRYLDDWLVQASSREDLLRDLGVVLSLCHELGIVVNPEKSNFSPSQVVQYLGVVIDARTFMASPSPDRVSRLRSTAGEFLHSAAPPASLWQSLLGMMSSLSHLVPGGRLRMRSLQICLHHSWDRLDPSAPVPWSLDCLRNLRWWLHVDRLSLGVSLHQVSPDLDFWPDALDVGWGAHLGDRVVSGLWDQTEALLPVNARELLAVRRGLLHFQSFLFGTTVAVFCDNITAVTYLRKEGGTRSPALNTITQEILRWAKSLRIRLAPQFIPGIRNVLADSLSRPHQLPSSEWSLNMDVFRSLTRQWPVMIDLFATSDNHRCSIYFSLYRDPLSAGTDALLQSWDGLLAYSFPPWSILPQVLSKLRMSHKTLLTLIAPYWPQCPWFVDLLQLSVAPPVALSACPDLLFQPRSPVSPQAGPSCLETVQRFTRAAGFSSAVAAQSSLARRPSSHSNYQLKWSVYRSWCRSQGHSISRPSLSEVSDFLCGSARFGALVSRPSRAIDRCSPWCSCSISLPSLATRFFGTCCVPLGYLLHPTRCVLLPGTSRRFCVFQFPALLNLFATLRCTPYPRRFFSCLRWLLPSL